MKIVFLDAAQEEFEEAKRYYNRQRSGLGEEFAEEVKKALKKIRRLPGAWTNLGEGIRRCRTDRFPYGLVYTIEEDHTIIVAVMHLHRDPGYWKDRL